ncbi:CoA pyrophosphatase [Motiliproteus coralliicola]|uniref:CoA pyrophosphatase n=1 Tax=Motiliproteus coralliicola TaxID=2283196 RepID=A0A369WKN4_9GAMM|nr:CoA pyrophosphatase [Motiliproteus coralliicola]RDE22628.1 CoA pyrophosphatase [Motiliproteus coralliicola]
MRKPSDESVVQSGASLSQQLSQRLRRQPIRRLKMSMPEAGVLVALTDHPQDPQVVLTRRASQLSSHAGEVAFPGGKRDPEDADLLATALRESHEEIDLAPDRVEVVGPLGQVVSKHGFLVSPFLGVISDQQPLTPNLDELESLFKVPLSFLLDRHHFQMETLSFEGRSIRMPRYDYQGYVIWGLSAFILVEMLNQGFDADLPLELRPESRR